MNRVRGLKSLIHDAVDHTVDLVALGQDATARSLVRVASLVEPLAEPAQQIEELRRLVSAGILGTIKGVNHLVAAATDLGIDALAPLLSAEEAPIPLRSDLAGSAAWLADAAVGAVNGVVGDHLAGRANGLHLGLALRGLHAWIDEEGGGIPEDAGPKIAVLVHGLLATEWSWSMDAARLLGDPAANFGTLLQADLGYTPVFVRYNTGRHISESGAALAARLEALVARWPGPVEEIALIGHSMGGLVLRSAVHLAHAAGMAWVARVRRVVTLASPMQGAPLERFGNAASALLSAVDLPGTLIPARLINGRSAGIKDLRYGYVHEAEWAGGDPDAHGEDRRQALTLPPHIAWCFIAASLGGTPEHPLSQAMGDGVVRVESASGPVDAPLRSVARHVGGVHHNAVQVDPKVYAIIRDFLTDQT